MGSFSLGLSAVKLAVLNPTPQDPLNYDYGYSKKRPVTHANIKARAGAPYYRDLTDVPHQFILSWADRPLSAVRELKRYYEQYRDGAFILIDHEGGGREYVGRFTTPVEPVPTRNASWTVQQVQFDELPGVPMRNYPQDWGHDSIWVYPFDFLMSPRVATQGTWNPQGEALAVSGNELFNSTVASGDWAQLQYVGYGFQFWARTGPDLGQATLYLDGLQVATLDFYTAAATKSAKLFSVATVPYGTHRVKLLASNAKNSSSTGTSVVWDSLRVMR